MSRRERMGAMGDIELPFLEHATLGREVEQQMTARSFHSGASGVAVGVEGDIDQYGSLCPRNCERSGKSVSLRTTRMPQDAGIAVVTGIAAAARIARPVVNVFIAVSGVGRF